MQVVTNEPRIKRNKNLAQILFVVSLVILIGGLIFTNTLTRSNDVLLFVPCLVMPLGLLTTMVSVRLTNQYVRPPRAHEAIAEGIRGLSHQGILYNYVVPNVSHVLVAPYGVFTFTTRFQESRFKVEGEKWYNWKARGPLAPLFLFLRQEGLGEPFKQATKEAEKVQALVDKALPGKNVKVQPMVVFTSPKAVLELDDPAMPVAYADPKQKPSLKSELRDVKHGEDVPNLTGEDIEAMDDAILAHLTPQQCENQFVEDI